MGIIKNSISNVLFSKVQQRLLTLFYGRPDCTFHTNEIIRITHSGTGSVQRELKKMADAGLVLITQVGNQKHYQANSSGFLFQEMRSIVLKTFGLADIIQHVLEPVAAQIHIAFIYGSIAKQNDTANSDIDIMLISNNLTYADLFPLLEKAEAQTGRPISPTIYSSSEWIRKQKKDNHFLSQVVKQPKIFLTGNEDELKKLGYLGKNKSAKN